jgi:TonB family protein
MDKPMDAMRVCLDELITHWGIDAAANRTLTRRAVPKSDPRHWLTPDDFPAQMMREQKSGVVNFRLMIDPDGTPTKCVVQTPGGSAFDETTCNVLKRRARFAPALDASGRPIASFYVNTVRWLVPR